jgi:hypothetical protein
VFCVRANSRHFYLHGDSNARADATCWYRGLLKLIMMVAMLRARRLLTAIHKEHRELLDRMRARHKLGAELLKTRQMLKDSQHLRELGVGEGGGNGAVYLVGKELAPSRYNSFYQTPKNAHFSIGHPEASHENKHSRKHPFTQASGRTTQLIARTASSTLRAAGVAVSKLLSAAGDDCYCSLTLGELLVNDVNKDACTLHMCMDAGKALAEEAKSDLSDQIDEPADHTDNGIAEESKEATSRRPQQGNWRKVVRLARSCFVVFVFCRATASRELCQR